MKKTIGIIGGMGPMATADLFKKICAMTDAATDCDHLHVFIDSNTAIPDRTEAILRAGPSPVPQMCISARKLASIGADVLLIPCNTAHYFFDGVAASVDIPVLNMIEETVAALRLLGVTRAGILATEGTVQSGVYAKALGERGVVPVCPDAVGQQAVTDMIYRGIKAGVRLDPGPFLGAVRALLAKGAQTLILGCTELPIAFETYGINLPAIDPTTILAQKAIVFAGGKLKV